MPTLSFTGSDQGEWAIAGISPVAAATLPDARRPLR